MPAQIYDARNYRDFLHQDADAILPASLRHNEGNSCIHYDKTLLIQKLIDRNPDLEDTMHLKFQKLRPYFLDLSVKLDFPNLCLPTFYPSHEPELLQKLSLGHLSPSHLADDRQPD